MTNPTVFDSIQKAVKKLAKQNDSVDQVIDDIVEHVSSLPGANHRSDWEEIIKTAENLIVGDLTFGSMMTERDSQPQTGPNKPASSQNSERETQGRNRKVGDKTQSP